MANAEKALTRAEKVEARERAAYEAAWRSAAGLTHGEVQALDPVLALQVEDLALACRARGCRPQAVVTRGGGAIVVVRDDTGRAVDAAHPDCSQMLEDGLQRAASVGLDAKAAGGALYLGAAVEMAPEAAAREEAEPSEVDPAVEAAVEAVVEDSKPPRARRQAR